MVSNRNTCLAVSLLPPRMSATTEEIFSGPNYDLFYSWRVPGCVLMLSYILSFKITKVSNIYFITVLVFWLAVAIVSIWMN